MSAMRVFIINFEMDRLSRSMSWSQQIVTLLAKRCEKVVVLTQKRGDFTPAPNVHVEVFSFPRVIEVPFLRWATIIMANWKAFRLIRKNRLDVCFVHMAFYWINHLRWCFRLFRMPTLVWYAHGTVHPKLATALRLADRFVTSSPQGLRIPSDKVRVIGQGIDTHMFVPQPLRPGRETIVAVSRLSPRKRIDVLVEVMRCLCATSRGEAFKLKIIGEAITRDDEHYAHALHRKVLHYGLQDRVEFVGFVSHERIPVFYRSAFLHLNVSRTGSMDKAVLESLACGCPVLTSNEAFFELLKDYPELIATDASVEAMAERIMEIHARRDQYDREALRSLVMGTHDLEGHIERILLNLQDIRGG